MISKDILFAERLLREGKLVAIPTETVYGLAANAFDTKAVSQIFAVKQRPNFDPLIVHTNSLEKVMDFVQEIPEMALRLAHTFWAGSLTLLLPKKSSIPDLVTSGLPDVAVRIPAHPLALALLHRLEFPLAAPSANPFGYISPTTAQHVDKQLGNKIPLILDGGNCQIGIESTIVGFEQGIPTIYRAGGISVESIERIVGRVRLMPHSSSSPMAPGQLKNHYAPRKPLILGDLEKLVEKFKNKKIGTLSFQKKNLHIPTQNQYVLSASGNFVEAAQNLFAAMRLLDEQDIDVILAELLPEKDLGRAINDRLRRASIET